MSTPSKPAKQQNTMKTKKESILKILQTTILQVQRDTKIPRRMLRSWLDQREEIMQYNGRVKRKKVTPGSRPPSFSDPPRLLAFMKQMREVERALTALHRIHWVKHNQRKWLHQYLATKKSGPGYSGLVKLMRNFACSHGYSR
ncbi:hypothetical protein AeMF1_019857 [Aphanomyces euteiches]|nr:hypothetical protein AeMF1_019857 [Aphanomyces euteiches]KAH9186267.1 hypothetical protein AeNC1_011757 [Aphanomyces euteiches]